jgi:hypothetical protein
MPAKPRARAAIRRRIVRNVTPDRLDLRDRPYQPSVALVPGASLAGKVRLAVHDQGSSSACTGFALATVVEHLLKSAGRDAEADVSAFMLYSMARRYDEFAGAEDAGSSLRGALKGWYKHGACARALWRELEMPAAAGEPGRDWWLDAVRRPMGAYYRVDARSITDMHVALNEVGVLYASAVCHAGWLAPLARGGLIDARPAAPGDGGHAFAIVGYDRHGFRVHNSWGKGWGEGGLATLTYEDWLENAMDCWVAQLGVVTEEHRRVARSATPAGSRLAADETLRRHQLAPYVIDMERDGELSRSGGFRTGEDDVRALAHERLAAAVAEWKLRPGAALDIAIYAHGGLTGEREAAATFARWLPALWAARRFPVFLMWESDLGSTLRNRLDEVLRGHVRPAAGPLESLGRWWNERLERLLAPAGAQLWGEMKENAAAISGSERSGARLFFRHLATSPAAHGRKVRLHLVGHSAGAIVHAYLVDRLAAAEWDFASLAFLAPALRVDAFRERVEPWLRAGRVRHLRQYHLTDTVERQDPTCRLLLGYGRSLLYLVSRAFEGGREVPILGMERHFPSDLARLARVAVFSAPSARTGATTHGGFDEDAATMADVIAGMR